METRFRYFVGMSILFFSFLSALFRILNPHPDTSSEKTYDHPVIQGFFGKETTFNTTSNRYNTSEVNWDVYLLTPHHNVSTFESNTTKEDKLISYFSVTPFVCDGRFLITSVTKTLDYKFFFQALILEIQPLPITDISLSMFGMYILYVSWSEPPCLPFNYMFEVSTLSKDSTTLDFYQTKLTRHLFRLLWDDCEKYDAVTVTVRSITHGTKSVPFRKEVDAVCTKTESRIEKRTTQDNVLNESIQPNGSIYYGIEQTLHRLSQRNVLFAEWKNEDSSNPNVIIQEMNSITINGVFSASCTIMTNSCENVILFSNFLIGLANESFEHSRKVVNLSVEIPPVRNLSVKHGGSFVNISWNLPPVPPNYITNVWLISSDNRTIDAKNTTDSFCLFHFVNCAEMKAVVMITGGGCIMSEPPEINFNGCTNSTPSNQRDYASRTTSSDRYFVTPTPSTTINSNSSIAATTPTTTSSEPQNMTEELAVSILVPECIVAIGLLFVSIVLCIYMYMYKAGFCKKQANVISNNLCSVSEKDNDNSVHRPEDNTTSTSEFLNRGSSTHTHQIDATTLAKHQYANIPRNSVK